MNTLVLAQAGGGFAGPITDAVSGMSGDFMTIAGVGIAIGVVLVGARKGFKFLKSLI